MGRTAGRFARVEPRCRVRDLVLGVLSDLPRKNCWSIAERAGNAGTDGMQHLLGRARRDADRVRHDVREYALEHLQDEDEDAVLVVDETGDVKEGTHTVGAQARLAEAVGRGRLQGTPLLRLGVIDWPKCGPAAIGCRSAASAPQVNSPTTAARRQPRCPGHAGARRRVRMAGG